MPWTTTDEFNVIPKTQRMSLASFPGLRHRSRRPICVILTRGGEWNEKLCVIGILLVVDSRWADDMTYRRGENRKKDWAQHRTLRDTSAQRGVSRFWLTNHNPLNPGWLSTNESNWSRYPRYRTPSGVWSRVCGDQLYQSAALRSSDTRIVGWLESAAVYTWSSVFNSDISVEWKRR